MLKFLLHRFPVLATIIPYKWETIPTDNQPPTEETEMPNTNNMIVNTFRDYLRFLAADCGVGTKARVTENFRRARTVRILARDAGVLSNLDRAIQHDSLTRGVFVNHDFKAGSYLA